MTKRKIVELKDSQCPSKDCHNKFNISKKYLVDRSKFINMITQFSSILDEHVLSNQHRQAQDETSTKFELSPLGTFPSWPTVREFQGLETKKWQSRNAIEPTQSEWAAPIVFGLEKDGALRFCVENRILDTITRWESYPISKMDECIAFVREATIFFTLDANSGYWKVEIKTKAQKKRIYISKRRLSFWTYAVWF